MRGWYINSMTRLSNIVAMSVLCAGLGFWTRFAHAESAPAQTERLESGASVELETVSSEVQQMIQSRQISGAVVLVEHKGAVVHHTAHGLRDIESEAPMKTDTIFRIYSMTKPVTSVAALMLVEEGRLNLDDSIDEHLPEFSSLHVRGFFGRRAPLKQPVTVRDLLRHTSGMTYGFFGVGPVDLMYMKSHPLFSKNSEEMVAKMGRLPLVHQPGSKWRYSMSTDVLGVLVERVSGQSLGDFFDERLFEPLGMIDTAFSIPDEKIDRFTSTYGINLTLQEDFKASDFRNQNRFQSGGGGLVSTAADYLRFAKMLRNGGELDGRRYLSAETVEMMTTNQLPKGVRAQGLFGFGLGVRVQLETWGDKAHKGQYGWDGVESTHFWISPSDELVVIALSQRKPFSLELRHRLTPVVYRALADHQENPKRP